MVTPYAAKKEKGNATAEDRKNNDLKLHKLHMESRDGILTFQTI